jgi:integrase
MSIRVSYRAVSGTDPGRLLKPQRVLLWLHRHSTIAMTADVYGHLFPRGDDSAELAAAEKSFLV